MEPENIQMQSNKSRASRLYATAVSRLKLGWLQTTAVVLNTMTIASVHPVGTAQRHPRCPEASKGFQGPLPRTTSIPTWPDAFRCVFWWCIVVGTVLSFILNNIIEAPRYRFTGLPVLIFMTGSLGLIVCLAGLKCIKGRGHFGLITYVASLGLMALFVLTVAVELLLLTLRPRQLHEWIDTSLKEVFAKGAATIQDMEAVFLLENQLECCGFNGTSFYPSDSLSVGCCRNLSQTCTLGVAYTKDCRTAFVEMVLGRFCGFGSSLIVSLFIIVATILNAVFILIKLSEEKC
ncbi:unnamed protein product [Mesocestoides corti]|uniref:Tetraspanin n=1 Tax=Mesocestoides corti TaxID=53468 RepID=A0A0R3U7F5_MESCO|nr:unnamed protein product [Mesocestoides corti]